MRFKDGASLKAVPQIYRAELNAGGGLPNCENITSNKDRDFVCFTSPNREFPLDRVLEEVPGVASWCASRFTDGTLLVVRKSLRSTRFRMDGRVGSPWTMKAVVKGRFSFDKLRLLFEHIGSQSQLSVGTLLLEVLDEERCDCSFEGLCRHFRGWNPQDFSAWKANAKWA